MVHVSMTSPSRVALQRDVLCIAGTGRWAASHRMQIKGHWDLCQPQGLRQPWRALVPTWGSCREHRNTLGTALCVGYTTQLALVSFLKCLWAAAGAEAARGVPALLRWAQGQLWPLLGPLELKQGSLPQSALSCSNRERHWSRPGLSNTGLVSNVLPQELLAVPRATGQPKC